MNSNLSEILKNIDFAEIARKTCAYNSEKMTNWKKAYRNSMYSKMMKRTQ